MDIRIQRLTVQQAKEIDLVDYLSTLGFESAKIRSSDFWYLSPLRLEKTPSFKVNRALNRWYDHGIGKGGNLIDFAVLFYSCPVKDFLQNFSGDFSLHQPVRKRQSFMPNPACEKQIKIVGEFSLASSSLCRYLKQRRVAFDLAEKYCREVRYELNGKTYYGIGFKNDLGGWEIRNPYFKASSSPKGITSLSSHAEEVIVFEGFIDFLSFKTLQKAVPSRLYDFVVLNSLAFFERARPFMESHRSIRLYLDRDSAGQNVSNYALSLSSKYCDDSDLYANHKDYNDWIMDFRKPDK